MMAKMFYTLDEARAALGKNEEELKQLTREGRLREFRDGPRLMYKADQVESLKAEFGGGSGGGRDQVDLGPSDTGAGMGLVDTRGGSGLGSGISLADTDAGSGLGSAMGSGLGSGMGSGLGSSRAGSLGGISLKDDTNMQSGAGDLGLSGSVGGIPSPSRGGGTAGLSGSGSGSRAGINLLGESSAGYDPNSQTAINSGISDQVNLEGVGSGSGLLDLTRESDDTSLGADLLDEIQPGGSGRRAAIGGTSAGGSLAGGSMAGSLSGGSMAGSLSGGSLGGSLSGSLAGSMGGTDAMPAAAPAATAARGRAVSAPVFVEARDPLEGLFAGAALAAAVVVCLGAFALTAAVLGTKPAILDFTVGQAMWKIAVGALGVGVVFGIVGIVVGKSVK